MKKLHLSFFACVCAWICISSSVQFASAQIQGHGMFLGNPGPPKPHPLPETRAQKQQKSSACNKAASDKGLKEKDRTDYLKSCNETPYSDPFTPPDWPPK
jgi:hypothetical protein